MIQFLLGAVVGAVIMLLVYRNNKSKMEAIADKLNQEIKDLKDKSK